jgi:acetolactate synthase-1/2/3 large subunit
MFGMHGSKKTNLLMQEADLLIVAGARFDDRATGKIAEFCPQANVIHIDIDASEIHKLRSAHIGVLGDVGEALTRLNDQLPQQSRPQWIDRAKEARCDTSTVVALTGKDQIRPFELIRDIAEHVGEQAFIATDVGQHQMWTAQHYPFCRSRHWLTSGGLGTMGFGLPTAIGAALANPDNPVVCFSGDGSFLMNIQELATLAQEQLNVKIILLDNQALGLVRQQQSLFYDNRLFASEFANAIDFVAIAKGFGIKAVSLKTNNDSMLAYTLRQPGPCLIHVPIDRREMVFPMVPPGAANTTMLEGECHACA